MGICARTKNHITAVDGTRIVVVTTRRFRVTYAFQAGVIDGAVASVVTELAVGQ